jgi:hypothetical protein
MSSQKPLDLVTKHLTKADRRQRSESAKALTPRFALSKLPPKELTGKIARATWTETVRMYFSVEAQIVTAFEKGLLIDFCNVTEHLDQIDKMRSTAMDDYLKHETILQKVQMGKQVVEPKVLLKLIDAVNESVDQVIKLDARADRKRGLLLTLRQSLLMTPRSRAGVKPDERQLEQPQSEIERIIDGVREKKEGAR